MGELSESGQAGDQIEVTPQMIEAGAMELLEQDTDQVSWQDRAEAVYRVMVAAKQVAT